MTIEDIYSLVTEIEKKKEWLFIIYPENNRVGVDVLEWEAEDGIDGGWFDSVDAAYEFIKEYEKDF